MDEFLEEKGCSIKDSAESIEVGILQEFSLISNPKTGIYTSKMEDGNNCSKRNAFRKWLYYLRW